MEDFVPMKPGSHKREGRFAQRALGDFQAAMLKMLKQMPFEKITVRAVCNSAGYPRSTFYNYFEDLYDLMDCCWQRIVEEAGIARSADAASQRGTATLFEKAYDFMDSRRAEIESLLAHNREGGALLVSLRLFIRKTIRGMLAECDCRIYRDLPEGIVAEHYANTVEMLLEQSFLAGRPLGKNQALACLDLFIGTLERKRDEQ